MAVLKDYKCDKHGYFESRKPQCLMKNCSEEVYVVFLQAPGLITDATKKNDKNIKQLAMDFDMTDIKSTREGENQSGFFTRKNKKYYRGVPDTIYNTNLKIFEKAFDKSNEEWHKDSLS